VSSDSQSCSQELSQTPEVLNENPSLAEILWNFRHFKDKRRLTLKQNPHFYTHIPMSPDAYGGGFEMKPTEDFRHANKFYVLTDRQGLAYFKTDQCTRCFGNFWSPNGAVIFKGERVLYLVSLFFLVSDILLDLSGGLVGENIIKASLETKHWLFCTRPLGSETPILSTVVDGRRPQPNPTLGCPCENWTRQIDGLPGSNDINLIICAGRVPPDNLVRCHGYLMLNAGTFC